MNVGKKMNYWTKKSVEIANQRNYLDELFKVYPMTPNLRRDLPKSKEKEITKYFDSQENQKLIEVLLSLELFPLKDSYVAYLKRDKSSIKRNPETVNRLAGNLYQMGLESIFDKCTEPKETNRQIGPLFKRWIDKKVIGVPVINDEAEFLEFKGNAIYNSSDNNMSNFCTNYLGYNHNKGIDFIAKFNNKYIIGEAKFLSDFGGHQNAQFNDAISTITSVFNTSKLSVEVLKIAILDGVLFIPGNNKMYKHLIDNPDQIIISSLLLRDFLYSL